MSEPKGPWYKQLHWQIFIGLLLAFVYALIVRQVVGIPPTAAVEAAGESAGAAARSGVYGAAEQARLRAEAIAGLQAWRAPFSFVGDLFLRLLKLIIIPLILTSVVAGIQSLGSAKRLGRLGALTIGYYLTTSFLAVIIGLGVVNILQPGKGLGLSVAGDPELEPTPLADVFLNIVPENIVGAMAAGDMLPTIFVAILAGLAMLVAGERVAGLRKLLDEAHDLVMMVTDWIMATAPVGVGALFAATLLDPQLADLTQFFSDMGVYMLAVVGGLSIHAFVVLPLILLVVTRFRPLAYLTALAPALLTAFSTASSSATYPVTLDCVTDRAGVSQESADFVLPLGATINMDGTALYEAVAAVFIANALGFDLTFAQQVIIVLTATLAAIGAAGVPSAGLVTMIIVLESVGLPGAGYALVVAVDRILDMCRTTVNVWGDSVGAAVVSRFMDGQAEIAPR
jgi:Na+/H+-dicarboxylate symporter